ncbi:MAG: hydrogen gas-evolving membrane-bound hydrogenase subunit E [Bdellovibrionota bacterium]
MKKIYKIVSILFFIFLCFLALDFRITGDVLSPPNVNVSPYYVENSYKDAYIPNVVSTILADYRGFDTMFETTVILTAAIALILILSKPKRRKSSVEDLPQTTESSDLVVQTTCKLVMPVIQLFALYVIVHGHYSPGGGFQGGVILGASFIFYAISFGIPKATNRFFKRTRHSLAYLGVLIYASVGLLCLLLKKNFLDYSALKNILLVSPPIARSYGVLFVELGVALTVNIVMFTCFIYLAAGSSFDKGLKEEDDVQENIEEELESGLNL